jgi:hypothetical protein
MDLAGKRRVTSSSGLSSASRKCGAFLFVKINILPYSAHWKISVITQRRSRAKFHCLSERLASEFEILLGFLAE